MGNVRQFMRLLGIRSYSYDYDHHAKSVACLSSARRKVYHHLKFIILHLQILIDDKEIKYMYLKITLIRHIFLICQNFLILFDFFFTKVFLIYWILIEEKREKWTLRGRVLINFWNENQGPHVDCKSVFIQCENIISENQ